MDTDGRRWSRRRFLLGSPLLAVGTAGCMRFATDSSAAALELSDDDVDVPAEASLHDDVSIRVPFDNDTSYVGEGTVVVRFDDRTIVREPIHLEPGSETTLETEITPTERGDRELSVEIESEDGESIDRWSETLVVTGRRLTFRWADTFVPAENAANADNTNHLAFACFALQFRAGDTVVEEYEIGADPDVEFVSGAYRVKRITGAPARFDGERGRWLGTEDQRTELVVSDEELLERAETLQLHGYSLFETASKVRVRTGETTLDIATVPPRDADESVLEVDLSGYDPGA